MLAFHAITPRIVFAQNSAGTLASHHDPQKFNLGFSGIGPHVYILPPPKTEQELVIESYVLKKEDQKNIDSLLVKINLKKELKYFSLQTPPIAITDSLIQDKENFLLAGIQYYQTKEALNFLSEWQNNLAVFYFLEGHLQQAEGLFKTASKTKAEIGAIQDQLLVLNNLALLETERGNFIQALAIYNQILDRAIENKNLDLQTSAYMAMARLEANLSNFSEAHNLVIKKSMPILQRSKNYSRIVDALNELASFKEMQKSDTEAKWIYLQAVDVAKIQNDEKGMAISLFNLAELKSRIEDLSLAIKDYHQAKEIAMKFKMEDLLFEIHDGLGDAYLKLHNYKAAALTLNEYLMIKSDLLFQNQDSTPLPNPYNN